MRCLQIFKPLFRFHRFIISVLLFLINWWKVARGGAVGWGTALQAGRPRVRFPMGSFGFFFCGLSGCTMALVSTQSVTEMSTRVFYSRGKGGRYVWLTNLPPSCADFVEILGASTQRSPTGLSRPFQRYLYLFFHYKLFCLRLCVQVFWCLGFVCPCFNTNTKPSTVRWSRHGARARSEKRSKENCGCKFQMERCYTEELSWVEG